MRYPSTNIHASLTILRSGSFRDLEARALFLSLPEYVRTCCLQNEGYQFSDR